MCAPKCSRLRATSSMYMPGIKSEPDVLLPSAPVLVAVRAPVSALVAVKLAIKLVVAAVKVPPSPPPTSSPCTSRMRLCASVSSRIQSSRRNRPRPQR